MFYTYMYGLGMGMGIQHMGMDIQHGKKKLTAFFLFSGMNTRRMVSEFDLVVHSFF